MRNHTLPSGDLGCQDCRFHWTLLPSKTSEKEGSKHLGEGETRAFHSCQAKSESFIYALLARTDNLYSVAVDYGARTVTTCITWLLDYGERTNSGLKFGTVVAPQFGLWLSLSHRRVGYAMKL